MGKVTIKMNYSTRFEEVDYNKDQEYTVDAKTADAMGDSCEVIGKASEDEDAEAKKAEKEAKKAKEKAEKEAKKIDQAPENKMISNNDSEVENK